jgi:glycosyltransferase involved in cell wall biosynthesis
LTPLIIKKDNYFQKIYYKFLTNISAKKADKIIAVSQNTKDDLNRLMGVPKSKIHVIYNFLEDNYSEFVEKRISIDRPYFLYVGNMHVGKNIINLIKAFALFKKRHNNNHVLLFIGKKGFGYNKIIDEIALRKLQNDVKILGYLEDNLIKSYYKKAHALVFPSYYEGFGYPPLEAIALQTVPIVSNIPPITEVVGECGFYFNPSDIEDIYKCFVNSLDNDLLNSKKEKIHRQLEKFNSEKSINQMLSLFKETII